MSTNELAYTITKLGERLILSTMSGVQFVDDEDRVH